MRGIKELAYIGIIGILLISNLAVGLFLGNWIDKLLNIHAFIFIGIILGIAAGFRSVFRLIK